MFNFQEGQTFTFYFFSRQFLDLNYFDVHKSLQGKNLYSVSNKIPFPRFRKGFIVLKLEGVLNEHPFQINYKILKYIDDLFLEVKFTPEKREIYIWLFVDGVRRSKLIGRLNAVAPNFSTLFPSTQTEILQSNEIEELIYQYQKCYALTSKKKVGLDFTNPYGSANKLDELLRALTTVDESGSIILYFNLHELPKTLLKKKQFHFSYGAGMDQGSQELIRNETPLMLEGGNEPSLNREFIIRRGLFFCKLDQ